jgi:hypothetical protein
MFGREALSMTLPLSQDLAALSRVLDGLAPSGTGAVEIREAREAIRRASEGDPERALQLARMAVDRARRAIGAAGDPRPAWRSVLQAPARTGMPREERRNLTGGARNPDVELDSEIPDAYPGKSTIEASVMGAFAGVKGRWRVAILVQPHAPWWGLRVEGASICWTGTLEGTSEQSAEFLAGRVREAVQLGLMQAALPKPRSRGL